LDFEIEMHSDQGRPRQVDATSDRRWSPSTVYENAANLFREPNLLGIIPVAIEAYFYRMGPVARNRATIPDFMSSEISRSIVCRLSS
jgi:hypothetical protein